MYVLRATIVLHNMHIGYIMRTVKSNMCNNNAHCLGNTSCWLLFQSSTG